MARISTHSCSSSIFDSIKASLGELLTQDFGSLPNDAKQEQDCIVRQCVQKIFKTELVTREKLVECTQHIDLALADIGLNVQKSLENHVEYSSLIFGYLESAEKLLAIRKQIIGHVISQS